MIPSKLSFFHLCRLFLRMRKNIDGGQVRKKHHGDDRFIFIFCKTLNIVRPRKFRKIIFSFEDWQGWERGGSVLACGHWSPGFDSLSRKLLFLLWASSSAVVTAPFWSNLIITVVVAQVIDNLLGTDQILLCQDCRTDRRPKFPLASCNKQEIHLSYRTPGLNDTLVRMLPKHLASSLML